MKFADGIRAFKPKVPHETVKYNISIDVATSFVTTKAFALCSGRGTFGTVTGRCLGYVGLSC